MTSRYDQCIADHPADEPAGYVERAAWLNAKTRTHTPHRCGHCGRWHIWRAR